MNRYRILAAIIGVVLFAGACSQGNVFDMAVGECFEEPSSLEFSDVEKIDCDEPHDNQVFALYDLAGSSLPSPETMIEGCVDRFGSAIGTSYATTIYYASMFGPSEQSWDEIDDREVVCYVYIPGEKTVGSALGSGR